MQIIIQILGLVGLSFLLVKAEPIIKLKEFLGFDEKLYHTYSSIRQFFHRLLYCEYCLSVWVTLFFTFDIYMIGCVSLITCLLSRIIL